MRQIGVNPKTTVTEDRGAGAAAACAHGYAKEVTA